MREPILYGDGSSPRLNKKEKISDQAVVSLYLLMMDALWPAALSSIYHDPPTMMDCVPSKCKPFLPEAAFARDFVKAMGTITLSSKSTYSKRNTWPTHRLLGNDACLLHGDSRLGGTYRVAKSWITKENVTLTVAPPHSLLWPEPPVLLYPETKVPRKVVLRESSGWNLYLIGWMPF